MNFPPLVSFAGMVAAANPGHLGMLAQMNTDEERMRYVSQLEKVRPGGNEPAWSICCGCRTHNWDRSAWPIFLYSELVA